MAVMENNYDPMADNGFYEYLRTQNLLETNPSRSLSVAQRKSQASQGLPTASFTSHINNLGGVRGSIAGFNQQLSSIYNGKGPGSLDRQAENQQQHTASGHVRRHTQLTDPRNSSFSRPENAEFLETMGRLGYNGMGSVSDQTQHKLWNHY